MLLRTRRPLLLRLPQADDSPDTSSVTTCILLAILLKPSLQLTPPAVATDAYRLCSSLVPSLYQDGYFEKDRVAKGDPGKREFTYFMLGASRFVYASSARLILLKVRYHHDQPALGGHGTFSFRSHLLGGVCDAGRRRSVRHLPPIPQNPKFVAGHRLATPINHQVLNSVAAFAAAASCVCQTVFTILFADATIACSSWHLGSRPPMSWHLLPRSSSSRISKWVRKGAKQGSDQHVGKRERGCRVVRSELRSATAMLRQAWQGPVRKGREDES